MVPPSWYPGGQRLCDPAQLHRGWQVQYLSRQYQSTHCGLRGGGLHRLRPIRLGQLLPIGAPHEWRVQVLRRGQAQGVL